MHNRNRYQRYKKQEDAHRINEKIISPQVKLVGEGVEPGIYLLTAALAKARNLGQDLVEVNGKVDPPICKIMDYTKFKYQQKKKQKQIKANLRKVTLKEIRLTSTTEENDISIKKKHATHFLKNGAKVKVYIYFSGRNLLLKEKSLASIHKFAEDLDEYGKIEIPPKKERRCVSLTIAPKK